MDRRSQEGEWKAGRKIAEGEILAMLLVETSERLLGLVKVARCDVNVTEKFVDIFRDYLELDSHCRKSFAISAFLNRELVYFSKLRRGVCD